MQELPCISLWAPWAQWVGLGWKPIETRTHTRFRSLVGQRIGIHASKSLDQEAVPAAYRWLTAAQRFRTLDPKDPLFAKAGGCLIATALVFAFMPLGVEHEADALIECRSVKRFGLILEEPELLPKPLPVKGGQGIFYVRFSDEIAVRREK